MGASYGECLKAQAHIRGNVDGCQEFKVEVKKGHLQDDVDVEHCTVCRCHKNFHKKVVQQVTQVVQKVTEVVYTECHKNHNLNGTYAKDGCKEFRKKSIYLPNLCDACDCDKSFHRNEITVWK